MKYGRYTPEFESEEEVQIWLESVFEEHGWTAIREVSPHSSKRRADLIAHNEDHGWFGIEVKYLDSSDCGGALAKAVKQIYNRYHGRKYIGNRINVWCLAPYYRVEHMDHHGGAARTIKSFINSMNIGYMSLGDSKLIMDFAPRGEDYRAWVGEMPECDSDYTHAQKGYGCYDEIESKVGDPPF